MLSGLPCTIYDVNPPNDNLDDSQKYEEFWSDWKDVEDDYDFEDYQLAIYLKTLKQQVFQERGGFLPSDRITAQLPYAPQSWMVHPAIVLQAGITTLIVFNLNQNAIQEVPHSDATWLVAEYGQLLGDIKQRIRTAQYAALKAVNKELIALYWDIGKLIVERHLVAINLKIGEFEPEYIGKVQFYLAVLDDKMRMPHENPAIGIILCKSKDKTTVEYALKDATKSIGVATYQVFSALPQELQKQLPEPEQVAKLLEGLSKSAV